jgi:hypothetical protein
MEIRKRAVKTAESIAAPLAVLAVNLLFVGDPGFLGSDALPYLVAPLFVAIVHGVYGGAVSLAASTLVLFFLVPMVLPFPGGLDAFRAALIGRALIPTAFFMPGVLVLGLIRDSYESSAKKLRDRFRKIVRKYHLLIKETQALVDINRVFEERIAGQTESLNALYSRIERFNTNDLDTVIREYLEAVGFFTKADKLSVWRLESGEGSLVRRADIGWKIGEEPRRIHIEGTIEGWAVRNSCVFSLRMLLQFENLARIDRKRNILTMPIKCGKFVWGVLNIEEMPFSRYNATAESNIALITALAQPAIQRATEYESRILSTGADAITGLPVYSQFRLALTEETMAAEQSRGISEIANFGELSKSFPEDEIRALIPPIIKRISGPEWSGATYYSYKRNSQFAVIAPGLDRDGASLFCLEALGAINSATWTIGGKHLDLEMVFGFASRQSRMGPDDIIKEAEDMLRVANSIGEMRDLP